MCFNDDQLVLVSYISFLHIMHTFYNKFWPLPIKKQYFDDVIQFWKCVHWIPRVSKPLPYMLKYKCGMYYVFIKLSFCLVQSESSILMTSYSFEIMSIVFYGCPNPLYVENTNVACIMSSWNRNFGLDQSEKQYIDDVIEFWKCVHWNPRVPKPLICLNTNVTCIMSLSFH